MVHFRGHTSGLSLYENTNKSLSVDQNFKRKKVAFKNLKCNIGTLAYIGLSTVSTWGGKLALQSVGKLPNFLRFSKIGLLQKNVFLDMLENNVLVTRSVTYCTSYSKKFPSPSKIRISERKWGKIVAILSDFVQEMVFKMHILNWFWCEFRANIIINTILKCLGVLDVSYPGVSYPYNLDVSYLSNKYEIFLINLS